MRKATRCACSGSRIRVGRHYIVDATTEEESQMSSAISVSLNRSLSIGKGVYVD
ncbi:hypothetical protein OROHE_004614 [Orobanche hederae]